MEKTAKKPKNAKADYAGVAERYRNGARIVDLAKEFGISRPGMYMRLKAEGVTDFRDDRKRIDTAEAIDMYEQGMTMLSIAKHFGVGLSTISMALKKHGVTTRRRAITPDLEKIDIAIPAVAKDTREAFKEFQKDFGKQIVEDRFDFAGLDDDDGGLACIKSLLEL